MKKGGEMRGRMAKLEDEEKARLFVLYVSVEEIKLLLLTSGDEYTSVDE